VFGVALPGANGVIDYDETMLRWMDRWVKGIPNGVDREPAVRIYVMGADEWRTADRWPLPGTVAESLFFGPRGALGPTLAPGSATPSTYVSDPTDPVVDVYDADYGAHDYRALRDRPDVLTFETAPLEADLDVVGAMRAVLHVSADAPDVDLYVMVLDVAPDGTAFNLMAPGRAVLRASYRDPAKRELLQPGRSYELTWDGLTTGNRFRQGHRIRVHVLSSFMPHFSVNGQTGALESTSAAIRAAQVTVRHDAQHPSRLVLPVVRAP
jgi:uncharacterized protein